MIQLSPSGMWLEVWLFSGFLCTLFPAVGCTWPLLLRGIAHEDFGSVWLLVFSHSPPLKLNSAFGFLAGLLRHWDTSEARVWWYILGWSVPPMGNYFVSANNVWVTGLLCLLMLLAHTGFLWVLMFCFYQ